MKTEEMLILGLTGAAAYLVWRMKSQKTAVVTQSVTSPVTYSPSSTAVVPEDSVPPSMPTMPMPSLPEPVSSSLATPVVLQVGPNERCRDVLVQNGYYGSASSRCLPKNLKLQVAPCDSGKVRESFPMTLDIANCAADEVDDPWRGIGKCVSLEENKLLSQPKPSTVPQGPIKPMVVVTPGQATNPYGEMCIPEAATVSISPCPEGQERNPEPCSWPGGRRYERSIWNRGQNFCPTGFKPNRGAIPCKLKCTGKPPPGLTEDLVKTFQSEYYIGPDEPGNTLPKCVPVGTNVTVDPCPPGQSRACHKMAWKCPEGQKIVSTSSCGKCYTPADPNRRVPYAEEQRKKSCLQNYGLIWNSATRKCEMRK